VLGCTVPLVEGLAEPAASEVVVALADAEIGAAKERDPNTENRFVVAVASEDVATALVTLDASGLPNRGGVGVLAALGEGALVPSRSAERARFLVGTAGEIEQSLRDVSGVLSARVHLAVPERDPLAQEDSAPPSAAVLVRHTGATPPIAADDIRRLVAGAVAGLRPEGVAVVLHPVALPARADGGRLTQLGPLSVSRSSAGTLRWVFAAVGALNVALALGLLLFWSKLRRMRREREATQAVVGEGRA
jgi:type III secretion protein J